MKKTIILGTIALLLTACSAMEEPSNNRSSSLNDDPNFISLDEALKNADNQFSAMFKSTRSGRTVIDTEELRTRTRSDADSLYGLYLVNYEDGFAMLSADARRPAVLAISEEGSMHLSDTTTNKGLALYLNALVSADKSSAAVNLPSLPADSAVTNPDDIDSTTFETRRPVMTIVPKLSTMAQSISQSTPYNLYCTTIIGNRAMAGCLPVSLAMYCSYYQYPKSISDYNILWGNDLFSWARFIEIMGRPTYTNVKYGVSYTDCKADSIASTFKKMNYSVTDFEDWNNEQILYAIFIMKKIAIAGGYNAGNLHTWVVDGGKTYTVTNSQDLSNTYTECYLHCAWGEGGSANGYFLYVKNDFGGVPFVRDANSSGSMPKFNNMFVLSPEPNE